MVPPANEACTVCEPTLSAEGLYVDSVATPLPFVVVDPTDEPSTVNPTVAPETGVPPGVVVRVAANVTGPTEPNGTDAGLGAESDKAVETAAGAATTRLALGESSVCPTQSPAVPVAWTWNVCVPVGTAAVVLTVSSVFFTSWFPPVRLDGANVALAPAGSPMAISDAVHVPLPLNATATDVAAAVP